MSALVFFYNNRQQHHVAFLPQKAQVVYLGSLVVKDEPLNADRMCALSLATNNSTARMGQRRRLMIKGKGCFCAGLL